MVEQAAEVVEQLEQIAEAVEQLEQVGAEEIGDRAGTGWPWCNWK